MLNKSFACTVSIIVFAFAFLVHNRFTTSAGNATTTERTAWPTACNNPASKIQLTGKTCGPAPELQLSCYLPADMVSPTPTPAPSPSSLNFITLQRAADIFSWQEFIALNWPVNANMRGEPDVTKKISDPGPRVWETWKEAYEVYLKDGAKPKPWNDQEPIPGACDDGGRVFFRKQKIDDVVDARLQAAAATGTLPATLTDQRGKLVRYEIRLNKVMFDYIVANQLYNANIQAQAKSIDFPNGAMLIKAAWKEITPSEEGLFHAVTACVCDQDANGNLVNCHKQRMGLVGFHITTKTAFAPQWIWSTFEQVQNVPGSVAPPYSFNNVNCSVQSCPPNQQTKPGTPNQLVRSIPIPNISPNCADTHDAVDNILWLNNDLFKALAGAGTVFRYYQLISTQWPVPETYKTPQPETRFTVRPLALGNTTMESYVQKTSTCMGCHSTARTVNQNSFVSSDFSFSLNNALPLQTNCKVIPPPSSPRTQWDLDYWPSIMRGYTLATHTYEILTANVPKAKLHCASCHLGAGGNSDAAWWADVVTRYTPSSLAARINHCFTNSLNGNQLCSPMNCATDPNMQAFINYMKWLNEQRTTLKLCNTVPNGYPTIGGTSGDKNKGEQIFIQKCAVCHQLNGEGRYEYDTYYRPALWGEHSFNKAAGMFTDPTFLAAFARWNMPLMAGGELSDEEAWDVATYVDSQPRPRTPAAKLFGNEASRRSRLRAGIRRKS